MKNLIIYFLFFSFLGNNVFASCDWTQVVKNQNNTYTYPENLHLCVGALVQQAPIQAQQISDLTQALQLKNAALLTSDQRTEMWIKNAQDSQDRLSKISADQKTNEWLFFGLGVATTFLAGYMAARLLHP